MEAVDSAAKIVVAAKTCRREGSIPPEYHENRSAAACALVVPDQAASPQAGWLTRGQVAAELGYRSIFPIRKMEGQALHPVRTARDWLFEPEEVAALKLKRPIGNAAAPLSEGRLAARVFHLFDTGRELREIVEELEVAPAIVRDLWHEWLVDLEEGEQNRRKTAQEERRRHAEEAQLRELERRNEQEQKNFETIMAAMNATTDQSGSK
jgi:hypothetical protein